MGLAKFIFFISMCLPVFANGTDGPEYIEFSRASPIFDMVCAGCEADAVFSKPKHEGFLPPIQFKQKVIASQADALELKVSILKNLGVPIPKSETAPTPFLAGKSRKLHANLWTYFSTHPRSKAAVTSCVAFIEERAVIYAIYAKGPQALFKNCKRAVIDLARSDSFPPVK